jgi:hypothetical protein
MVEKENYTDQAIHSTNREKGYKIKKRPVQSFPASKAFGN